MALKFTTTAKATRFAKALVYGPAGVGKTTLCKTAPEPIIISAEAGLLSLSDVNIPVIEITSYNDFDDAYQFINTSEKAKKFQTICLDSVTDIAEVLLADLLEQVSDPRQAYGEVANKMGQMIRKFRDIKDRHIYFTAKAKKTVDAANIVTYAPHMPGQQLPLNLPYWFDLVLPLRIGETKDKVKYRYLQTQPSIFWEAKDRSGCLPNPQKPDLSDVFERVLRGKRIRHDAGKHKIEELNQVGEPESQPEQEQPKPKAKPKVKPKAKAKPKAKPLAKKEK